MDQFKNDSFEYYLVVIELNIEIYLDGKEFDTYSLRQLLI